MSTTARPSASRVGARPDPGAGATVISTSMSGSGPIRRSGAMATISVALLGSAGAELTIGASGTGIIGGAMPDGGMDGMDF